MQVGRFQSSPWLIAAQLLLFGRNSLIRTVIIACFLLSGSTALLAQDTSAHAQPFVGRWLTSSKRGVIEISNCGGTLCARVVGLSPNRDSSGDLFRDGHNPDPASRTRTICGSEVFTNLRWNEQREAWAGRLYDAENGKEYEGRLSLEHPGVMKVRGSLVGFSWLSETVVWTSYQGELTSDCELRGNALTALKSQR
jgi:uncharacterized protein (DUF2147 family)